ncbi:MAG: hypothetical protein ACQESF_02590 [Nanobdellota archaeon]
MYCKKNRCLMLPEKCVKRRKLLNAINLTSANNRDMCKNCQQGKEVDKYFALNIKKLPYCCPEIKNNEKLKKRAYRLSSMLGTVVKENESSDIIKTTDFKNAA